MVKINCFLVFLSLVNLVFSQSLASKIVTYKMKPSITKENNLINYNLIKNCSLTNMNFGGVIAGTKVKSAQSSYKIVLAKPSDENKIRYKISFLDSSGFSKNSLGFIFEYPSMKIEELNNSKNNTPIQIIKKRDSNYKELGLNLKLKNNPTITVTDYITISGSIVGEILNFSTVDFGKIPKNTPAGDMIGSFKMKIDTDVIK